MNASFAPARAVSRLVQALVYPRSVDDYLELFAPVRASREIRARVVEVRRETHDVVTLVLRPNARWPGHSAGQHVALGVEIDGVRRTRVFSVSSAEGCAPEITMKALGVVTRAIVHERALEPGDVVTLSPPAGDFVLPDVLPDRLLFLSGGSGVTPVMSMLRTLRARGYGGALRFVHHARTARDVVFAQELVREGAEVRFGALEPRHLEGLVEQETWACGPPGFLDVVRGAFAARGAEQRLRTERFTLASASPCPPETDSAESSGMSHRVTFARSDVTAPPGAGAERTPLLVVAEQSGLSPAHGCRMGICKSCTCRKVAGATRDLRTGEINDEQDVDIQPCVTAAAGPVVLDL